MGPPERQVLNRDIEYALTLHLERASELAERAKQANNAAQHEIDCASRIAEELSGVSAASSVRLGELRSGRRDR